MPGSREEDCLIFTKHEVNFAKGVMKFTISCILPLMMWHTNLVKIGPVVLEEMLMHDNRCQYIAVGHLSDSGDLKI